MSPPVTPKLPPGMVLVAVARYERQEERLERYQKAAARLWRRYSRSLDAEPAEPVEGLLGWLERLVAEGKLLVADVCPGCEGTGGDQNLPCMVCRPPSPHSQAAQYAREWQPPGRKPRR